MSKRSIPRFALATLTLGGACSDGGGGKSVRPDSLQPPRTEATTTSRDDVATASCELTRECAPADFRESYTSIDECAQAFSSWVDDAAKGDQACENAILDYYGCFAELGCEAIESGEDDAVAACDDQYSKLLDLCEIEEEDYVEEEDYSTSY